MMVSEKVGIKKEFLFDRIYLDTMKRIRGGCGVVGLRMKGGECGKMLVGMSTAV